MEGGFVAAVETIAARDRRFAFGAAYAVGGETPIVAVRGPRWRGGLEPVLPGAPWHLGSITKSFTAAIALHLQERGVIDLDAAVGAHLGGEAHRSWRALTLRQALQHTAGLAANITARPANGRSLAEQRRRVLASRWSRPPPFELGRFRYSNVGYVLAAAVIEAAAQRPWLDLVQGEIARPLQLASLGVGAPRQPGSAWGHRSLLGRAIPIDPARESADNPGWMAPAGGLHLNLRDLVRWGQAQHGEGPSILSHQALKAMQTPGEGGYGLGLAIARRPDLSGPLVFHNGSNTFWYAVLAFLPDRHLTVAVALNTYARQRGDRAVDHLLQTLLG